MWIWESTIGIISSFGRVFAGPLTGLTSAIVGSGCGGRRRHSLERSLCGGGNCLECLGLADRNIGQHLAVEVEPGQLDAVHELRVGQPVLPCAGIDALNPQRAKIALAVAAVAIGVAQRLLDLLD